MFASSSVTSVCADVFLPPAVRRCPLLLAILPFVFGSLHFGTTCIASQRRLRIASGRHHLHRKRAVPSASPTGGTICVASGQRRCIITRRHLCTASGRHHLHRKQAASLHRKWAVPLHRKRAAPFASQAGVAICIASGGRLCVASGRRLGTANLPRMKPRHGKYGVKQLVRQQVGQHISPVHNRGDLCDLVHVSVDSLLNPNLLRRRCFIFLTPFLRRLPLHALATMLKLLSETSSPHTPSNSITPMRSASGCMLLVTEGGALV